MGIISSEVFYGAGCTELEREIAALSEGSITKKSISGKEYSVRIIKK